MGKQNFKPGNMLYPLPAVLVSVADKKGNSNLFTVAWTGTICSDPPMVSISVRPERYSYHMIEETGEFVINLTTEALAYATDYCGVKSGKVEGDGASKGAGRKGKCADGGGEPRYSGMQGDGEKGAGIPSYVSCGSGGGPCG